MRSYLSTKVFTCLLVCVCTAVLSLNAVPPVPGAHREVAGALLQTAIHAKPVTPTRESEGRIQPGTGVKLTVITSNNGDVPSAPGEIVVRFAFPKPLDKEPGSVLFETEPQPIPVIPPGETLIVNFETHHQWPSIFDYIRNDWAMREYEAVIKIKNREFVSGSRAISFSAYYYQGPQGTKPVRVTSADYTPERPTASRQVPGRGR